MTYYEVENEEVVKYEVILNREELEKIKQKIKKSHTEVTHVVKNSTAEPEIEPGQTIKNLQKKYLLTFPVTLGPKKEREVYEFQYDSYIEPRLVFLIDSLLEGNTNVIQEMNQFLQTQKKKDWKLSSYYKKVLKSIQMTEVCRIPIQETDCFMGFFLNEMNGELPKSEKPTEEKNTQKQKRV